MSKSELVPTLGGVLCADLESTWSETDETLAKVTAAFLASEGALAVSAEEDVGVTELRRVIEKTLIKHRDTLETVESTNGPGYQPISSV